MLRARSKKKASSAAKRKQEGEEEGNEAEDHTQQASAKPKKAKKEVPEVVTEIDPTPRKPLEAERKTLKVLSWNVDGLRAGGRKEALQAIVEAEKPEVLLLQETKLQEKDVEEWRDALDGYSSFWTCSQEKKGYAGCAAFVKQAKDGLAKASATTGKISSFFAPKKEVAATAAAAALRAVSYGIGPANEAHGVKTKVCDVHGDTDLAGRSITLEFDDIFVVNLYVPNAGQKLENLEQRVGSWDPALREYTKGLQESGKPVVVTGDLNICHKDIDIYNYFAKHLEKQPGCTTCERKSFDEFLQQGEYVDALRHFYPEARGLYTYWSTRANNRPANKGIRLDYFVCSVGLFSENQEGIGVHDCFTCPSLTACSDHCPVGLVLNL